MSAHQNPKRQHHHVWQRHLKSWATKDGAIWCLQEGRLFATGTPVIAVEKDFYKLQRLTQKDVALLKILFEHAHPLSTKHHAGLVNDLMRPFQMAELFGGQPKLGAEFDRRLDEYASNVLEDYHAGIEVLFLPFLDRALNADIGFYSDPQCCIPFLHYLSTQYMRTKGIKERSIELCNADKSADLARVWNVLIHMFAFNIGSSLFLERRRRKLVLVHNRTEVPFITGDQPAINLKGGARPRRPPENLCVYYPIAPQLALFLTDVDEESPFAPEGVTPTQASMLNRHLFEASYRQVFSQSKMPLTALSGRGTAQGN
jgi:hypothetical protein